MHVHHDEPRAAAVGLQGVGIAERAIQQAVAYARERRQGRTPGMPTTESSPIAAHPDVKRMLMTMRCSRKQHELFVI